MRNGEIKPNGFDQMCCGSLFAPKWAAVSPVQRPAGMHCWQAGGQRWHCPSRSPCAGGHWWTHWCSCKRRGSWQLKQWLAFRPQEAQPGAQLRHTWSDGKALGGKHQMSRRLHTLICGTLVTKFRRQA